MFKASERALRVFSAILLVYRVGLNFKFGGCLHMTDKIGVFIAP